MGNKILVYAAASLGILAAVPGRFAYGIIFAVELNALVIGTLLFMRLLCFLRLQDFSAILSAVFLVFFTVLFKLLLTLVSPAAALALGFTLYFPPLSAFVIGEIAGFSEDDLSGSLRRAERMSVTFSLVALGMFLFRDLFGYGTFTLPGAGQFGIIEFVVFDSPQILFPWPFWASIPGALVLCAAMVSASIAIGKKFAPSGRDGEEEDDAR